MQQEATPHRKPPSKIERERDFKTDLVPPDRDTRLAARNYSTRIKHRTERQRSKMGATPRSLLAFGLPTQMDAGSYSQILPSGLQRVAVTHTAQLG
jgi:hypothetical protein